MAFRISAHKLEIEVGRHKKHTVHEQIVQGMHIK